MIILRNDSRAGLFNGDTGVCLQDLDGQVRVYFRLEEGVRSFLPTSIPEPEAVFAMTVHRTHGSDFGEVHLLLPPPPDTGGAADSAATFQALKREARWVGGVRFVHFLPSQRPVVPRRREVDVPGEVLVYVRQVQNRGSPH